MEGCRDLVTKRNKMMLQKDFDQIQRCCSVVVEQKGKEKGGFEELDEEENLSPQHEKQLKQSRKRKNKTSIAKRAFDAEVVGSFKLDGYKDKVASNDDAGDLKATVAEKLDVGGLTNRCMNNKIMPHSRVRIPPHLSKEIIFNILVRLSAEIIYDVIRYVGPEWYNIVHDLHFIDAHLHQSIASLFIQNKEFPEFAHSVEVRETDVNVTKIGYSFRGPVWASCDGLVLHSDLLNRYVLHVANPVTKQHVSLPPLLSTKYASDMCSSGLAYAASTRKYKVAHVFSQGWLASRCLIVTLGIDNAWREIDMKNIRVGISNPICVGGFIYWCDALVSNNMSPFPCLDVETEEIHQIFFPKCEHGSFSWTPLAMGNSLSLVSEPNGYSFEVWLLKKPKTGEWIRMPDIDLEGQRHVYERIVFPNDYSKRLDTYDWWEEDELFWSIAWMKDGEMLIFRVRHPSKMFIVHNLKTGKAYSFDLDEHTWSNTDPMSDLYRPHIHSLVTFSQLG